MKLINKWLAIALAIMVSSNCFSQIEIKGKVSDSKTNEALPSANVYIPEQNKGTITNDLGEYEITGLSKGELKIQFSYIGYKTIIKTVITENEHIMMNVELEPANLHAEEVVVSGGVYSTQHENSITIETLKSDQLSKSGTPTFMEVISGLPGVDMISKGVGVAKPVIRGLAMTNVLMLNNGVKLENFQFSDDHPYIVDEFGVDQVEVIKGPASLLYGSDAVGGVINILHEKPAPIGKIVGSYGAQYHSVTEGVVSNIGVKGSEENYFWGIRSGIKSHADYLDGAGDFIPNTHFNEYSIKANVGISKSFGLFRFNYDYNRPKLGMSVDDAIPLIDERGRKNEYWYQDLTNHILSTKNTLFAGKYKFDVNVSYQMNNRKLQTDDSKPAFEMVNMDLNTFMYEIKAHLPSSASSEYILGIQGANKINKNHDAPNHVLPDANVNDFSFFGLVQHRFWSKVRAQAGMRYDFRSISTKADNGIEALDRNYDDLSASFGATYRVTENVLFRVNMASAYRTPNVAELTENGLHHIRYEMGNPDLKSQRNYEADFSAHYHSDILMLDFSGFYNRIYDYIFMAPTDQISSEGYSIFQYGQIDSKIYGGELSFDVLPARWFEINLNYGYLIGKQDNGDYLPFIPQNKLRFEMTLKKSELGVLYNPYIKFGGLYADKQSRPSIHEEETDSYLIFNLAVGANLKWDSQLVSLSIHASNLFNETYIDHLSTLKELSYNNMGRNISLNFFIPFSIK